MHRQETSIQITQDMLDALLDKQPSVGQREAPRRCSPALA